MPVKVRCDHCQKTTAAPDKARGKAIKCPHCQERIVVPAAKDKTSDDSGEFLASLDLRNAEDQKSRICPKCGTEIGNEEGETECSKCGFDVAIGDISAAVKKRRSGKPDEDRYYKGLWGTGWKFVGQNFLAGMRSSIYTLLGSSLALMGLFLYLYNSQWPLKLFFGLLGTAGALMVAGWLWWLPTQCIELVAKKKEKFKRLNFDFFTCSANGITFVAWNLAFAGPVLLVLGLAFLSLKDIGLPPIAWVAIAGVAYLPIILSMPIVIGHMTMPVQTPGWQIWKVLPVVGANARHLIVWLLFSAVANAPTLGCLGYVIASSGPGMIQLAGTMENNGSLIRAAVAYEEAMKAKGKKAGGGGGGGSGPQQPEKVDYSILTIPAVVTAVSILPLGFTSLFSFRILAQFVSVFQPVLGLIALAKQVKYVSKPKVDEDEIAAKPKTNAAAAFEAAITAFAFVLISGFLGGLAAVASEQKDAMPYVFGGLFFGARVAVVTGAFRLASAATESGWSGFWLIWCTPVAIVLSLGLEFASQFVPENVKNILFFVGVGMGVLSFIGTIAAIVYTAQRFAEANVGCFMMIIGAIMSALVVVIAVAVLGAKFLGAAAAAADVPA